MVLLLIHVYLSSHVLSCKYRNNAREGSWMVLYVPLKSKHQSLKILIQRAFRRKKICGLLIEQMGNMCVI